MAVSYLKKASKRTVSSDPEARPVVIEMPAAVEAGGEEAARDYARKLNGWDGDILVSEADLATAERQRDSQQEFESVQVAARISRSENMEGHAMTGNVSLAKYFHDERFKLGSGVGG